MVDDTLKVNRQLFKAHTPSGKNINRLQFLRANGWTDQQTESVHAYVARCGHRHQ